MAGLSRSVCSAVSACPLAYPLPTIMVTSLPTPSAPSAAAVNDVDIEKKYTMPSSFVDKIEDSSVPGTLTQLITTSASSGATEATAELKPSVLVASATRK